jgi:hypothetical protein
MKKDFFFIITYADMHSYAKYALVTDFFERRKSILSFLMQGEATVSMQMGLLPGA